MLKNTIYLFIFIYSVSCIICFLSTAQTNTRKCVIKSIVGDVKVRRGKSPKWVKARPNISLKESDAIRTFVESEVNIVTTEGSNLVIGENSTLELSDFSVNRGGITKTGVKILNGNVMANVKKLVNKKSKFEFETPTAVASIRGTRVGFDVLKSKTSIKVYEGKVYVSPKGSRKGAELKTNQMATVSKGQKEIVVVVMSEKTDENNKNTQDSLKAAVDSSSVADSGSIRISDSTAVPDSGSSGYIVPDSSYYDSESLRTADSSGAVNDESNQTIDADSTEGSENILGSNKKLELSIFSPENGQVVLPGIQLVIRGKVVPAAASLRINGTSIAVSDNGEFKMNFTTPKEPGQYEIEIDAGYDNETKTAIRRLLIKAISKDLQIVVNEPVNGSIVNKPSIKVSGFVTPGAEIAASGINIPVGSNGFFSNEIPIPDEEGEMLVEIEAILDQESKIVTRNVTYKPAQEEIILSVFNPTEKQILCTNKLLIKGTVRPVSINEISVNGTAINARNGIFSGFIMLQGDQGAQEIEFEAVNEDQSKVLNRTVYFDPVSKTCNKDIPVIQPTYMPFSTKNSRLTFTVYDKTLFDEVTVFTSIDGSSDSETG
ncbi:MAG: FecR family protein, partial [Chitinispirillia bacterium]